MYSKFSIDIEYNVKLNMKSKPSEKPYLRKCVKKKKKNVMSSISWNYFESYVTTGMNTLKWVVKSNIHTPLKNQMQ